MESSPTLRNTNSRGQDNPISTSNHASSAGSNKLRLMCSNGGHIVPRPHDKSLCYIGGETRMVVVDRHTTLRELAHRLSKTLLRSSSLSTEPAFSFSLKYQLPSEDLDSLISITNDEDLENMIEEYERLDSSSSTAGNKSTRLRLFVFPTNPESVSLIGSFLENSTKSEDWFLNALNGTSSGFSDTSSVNCLLDLDDEIEISVPEKKDANYKGAIITNVRGNNSGQDVHSIPDSPMMDTTSSFGSASSTPSRANLPPIGVNPGDHQKVVGGGIEEQFSGSPMTAVREHPDPFLSYQERTEQGLHLQMSYLKHQQQQFQPKQFTGSDLAFANSAVSDLAITDRSSPVVQIQSSSNNNTDDTPDQNTRIQTQQLLQNSACSMPTTQIASQHPQLYHRQLPIPPLQYIHQHHHPSAAVPVASYYNHHPHHPQMDHQNLVYYMPVRQPSQGYNFPFNADAPPGAATQAALKSKSPVDVYRPTSSGGPQLVQVPSGHQNQPQYVYATQSMPPAQYQKVASVSPVEACLQQQ